LKKAAQKLFMNWSRGAETPAAQTHKSLFGSFSSEKELLAVLVAGRLCIKGSLPAVIGITAHSRLNSVA
jgi:hypothetical protein